MNQTHENDPGGYGRIVSRKHSAPMIVIDCSEWGQILELTVTVAAHMTPELQATMTASLVEAINALDLAQGGTGFRFLQSRPIGTNVEIMLAPAEPENAKTRIAVITDALTKRNPHGIPGVERIHAKAA